jgi:hypothetical protein
MQVCWKVVIRGRENWYTWSNHDPRIAEQSIVPVAQYNVSRNMADASNAPSVTNIVRLHSQCFEAMFWNALWDKSSFIWGVSDDASERSNIALYQRCKHYQIIVNFLFWGWEMLNDMVCVNECIQPLSPIGCVVMYQTTLTLSIWILQDHEFEVIVDTEPGHSYAECWNECNWSIDSKLYSPERHNAL